MSTFRESLLLKVSGLAEQLEERLFHLYGIHNELIQERLQELAEVMERVGEAEAELRQVCRTVEPKLRGWADVGEKGGDPEGPGDVGPWGPHGGHQGPEHGLGQSQAPGGGRDSEQPKGVRSST
uniref:Synaptonemal complex central element protein 2 n=1 Tax=Amazona collaria TaxID=241587 RepID=A0A8B9FX81_9PSIT